MSSLWLTWYWNGVVGVAADNARVKQSKLVFVAFPNVQFAATDISKWMSFPGFCVFEVDVHRHLDFEV